MVPQRVGEPQIDDATEGKAGLCHLRPDFFHDRGRINQRPRPVFAISLANRSGLLRGQWPWENFLISELLIELHQHQFTHGNILPQSE